MMRTFSCTLLVAFAMALSPSSRGAELTPLRVNVFPTAKTLPMLAGIEKGIFAKHGLDVRMLATPNSRQQREGLAAGAFEIAQSAVDNAVAMVEAAHHDVVIVMGISSGMNEFIVQPDVRTLADVRGRSLVVDAPNTAYALVAKKILLNAGLKEGIDYKVKEIGRGEYRLKAMLEDKQLAATVTNPPYTVQAVQQGLKSLGRQIDMLGPYQADGVFVMRAWAQANATTLERYLAAYVEALRWSLRPENRAECIALLTHNLGLSRETAEGTYPLLVDPKFGFTPDAKLDLQGFRNLLALRAEVESKSGVTEPAEKYLDLTYYQRAMAALGI